MIKQLTIKNLAIIDDITIDFEDGFNVLTGETGAGKSIIIDALSLIFGARANNEIIAHGKDSAFISVCLYLNENLSKYIYDNYDIDVMDECIITRTLSNQGRSTCKINGIIVPLHVLQELSSLLIDISSQNESQYLLNHKNHLNLLDTYIESFAPDFKEKYINVYYAYKGLKKEYDELISKNLDQGQLEFLEYKYNELKDFNYSLEDIYNINVEYKELKSKSQNAAALEEIINIFDNDSNGVNSNLFMALKALGKLSSNEKLNDYYEKFNSLYLDLFDLTDEFKKEYGNDSIDLDRIDYLSNEITKINRFRRKYNVDDVLAYKNKLKEQIDEINNKEIVISRLEKQLNELKEKALVEAKKITDTRNKYALKLAKDVKNELNDLYLLDAEFVVNFVTVDLNKNGNDDVEFYMSANKGVPVRPLIKVASGGEVSRIMLGLKAVFSKLSMVDTIIFDEIDTGVSGKVASSMGKKMEKISKSAQVLAITHLPQVAALSDHHYYIYKVSDLEKTRTVVKPLNSLEKEKEVARLLSGDEISDSFILAAKELISSK